MCGSHFRDVHRGQYAGSADRYATSNPCRDENSSRVSSSCRNSAYQEEDRVQEHGWAPPKVVGKPACAEGTYSTAKQDRSNGETGACCSRTERLRQGVDGPVNDAAVKTKEKATDCGHAGKRNYISRTTSPGVERRGRNGIIQSEFFSSLFFSGISQSKF